MTYPSPHACALMTVRGLSDGETGADAPTITDPELCAVYVEARGLGTQRSGRDTCSSRAPLFASAFCEAVLREPFEPAPDPSLACVGDAVGAPSSSEAA